MASDASPTHQPVLLAETMEGLGVRPGGLYVDGTVGLGGHAEEVLRRSAPDGRLIGVDRDPESLELAGARLGPFGNRVQLHVADFRELPTLLQGLRANAILLDLGVNSYQLDTPERGFSFRSAGPLDMRLDRSCGPTAAEAVNRLGEAALAELIFKWGEERASRRVARAIVAARRQKPITTTTELAAIVRRAVWSRGRQAIDGATRTFQALRIHVNHELVDLGQALRSLAHCLVAGGRLAVISFHSLEDAEVKHGFRGLVPGGFCILTRKPIRPGAAEVALNPRSRSARLRVLEREGAA